MSFESLIQSDMSISDESRRGLYSKTAYLTLLPVLDCWGVIKVGSKRSKVWPSSESWDDSANALEVNFGFEDLTNTGAAKGGTDPGIESAWGWGLESKTPFWRTETAFLDKASEAAWRVEAAWEGDCGILGEFDPLGGRVWASLHWGWEERGEEKQKDWSEDLKNHVSRVVCLTLTALYRSVESVQLKIELPWGSWNRDWDLNISVKNEGNGA